MEGFDSQPQQPTSCECGYDPEKKICTLLLPNGRIIELIQTKLEEPNERDSFIRGFCPQEHAMAEVHLIEESGTLTVKKVSLDGETVFEIPTIH